MQVSLNLLRDTLQQVTAISVQHRKRRSVLYDTSDNCGKI